MKSIVRRATARTGRPTCVAWPWRRASRIRPTKSYGASTKLAKARRSQRRVGIAQRPGQPHCPHERPYDARGVQGRACDRSEDRPGAVGGHLPGRSRRRRDVGRERGAGPEERDQRGKPGQHREVVADKGYHAAETLATINEALGVRTYIPEPKRKKRWTWSERPAAERRAVTANHRCVRGARSKTLQRRRSEFVERSFAHVCQTAAAGAVGCTAY